MRTPSRSRRTLGMTLAGLLVVSGMGAVTGSTASADTAPTDPALPATVAADALPTVQVDGVVWAQATVGNTVWAVGSFSKARPAGAAPGTSEVDRRNVLAYDIRTGVRDTRVVDQLNAAAHAVAVSPDGRRVYVGGDFTFAGGARHERIVAFDTATGRVVHSFAAQLDQRVSALAATNDTVYVGGSFLTANGADRTRLAAFRASDGALLDWAPTAQDQPVQTMALTQDGRTLYVGGKFLGLNGNGVKGLGALDPVTGAGRPLPVADVIRNGGELAGITSLTVDSDTLYGTAFTYGGTQRGNLEGVFAARVSDGRLAWVADCHGDHYSSAAIDGVVYAAGHAHYCGNIGSFGQTDPWRFDRALAFTKKPMGTVRTNAVDVSRYFDFGGQPAPAALHWYPYLDAGTYTGQNQGPWSVTGNSDYVAYGGEFTRAMNADQQGLVRFARPGIAPAKIGPQSVATLTPTLRTLTPGTVRVAWQTSWDYDNRALTYRVVRDGRVSDPVHTVTVESTHFHQPWVSFTDTQVEPGSTHSYRIYVTDAHGNENRGSTVSTTVAGGTGTSGYARRVLADGAAHLWRFEEPNGPVADWAGGDDLAAGSGVTRLTTGAVPGDPSTSATFDGTAAGSAGSSGAVMGPHTFSVEAWVRTTSTAGGKVVGFGNRATGSSTTYDRHLYVDSGGRLTFGVYNGGVRTVRSPEPVNDGRWHHVVGTLGPAGQRLYVDGALVGQSTSVVSSTPVTGFWRLGSDNLSNWPNRPASSNLAGSLDEVAVYHGELSAEQVAAHHAIGTGQLPGDGEEDETPLPAVDVPTVFLRSTAEPTGGPVVDWSIGGRSTDQHLLCDWDGDGVATLGVYRSSDATWYFTDQPGSGGALTSHRYGTPGAGDRAFCGDWDGDGSETFGLFRASTNVWHLKDSNAGGAADYSFRYGRPGSGDTPLVGDWDGDGRDTPGIFRTSDQNWYLTNRAEGGVAEVTFRYGSLGMGDSALAGDWDGDGTDTPAIYRTSEREWHVRNSNTPGVADWRFGFGGAGDRPLAGDWDGDGRDEPAVSRMPAPPPR